MSSTSSPHLFSREPLRLGIIFDVRRTGLSNRSRSPNKGGERSLQTYPRTLDPPYGVCLIAAEQCAGLGCRRFSEQKIDKQSKLAANICSSPIAGTKQAQVGRSPFHLESEVMKRRKSGSR